MAEKNLELKTGLTSHFVGSQYGAKYEELIYEK
jgi:hypothetical protein